MFPPPVGVRMEHAWILVKVGDGTEEVFPPRLPRRRTVNMCKCVFSVAWQPGSGGFASVKGAQNIQSLTKPNYPRLLPFHRGSRLQTVLSDESKVLRLG